MPKAVGIYVGRNEVIAVSAVRLLSGPKIQDYVIEPIKTDGADDVEVGKEVHKLKKLTPEARAICKALEKMKALGAFVNAAISPFEVVTRHFMMPAVPKKEEAGAIQFEASRYIPFKLSESVLDYYAHTTHKNVFSVTVTAARRDIIETCFNNLSNASAKVLMIEPAYCALARAFGTLNVIGKSKTYGFAFIQSDGNVNITLAANGIVYLSRDFILGGNPEEDKTRFFEEIKASVDYFYKLTGGDAVGQIFLTGSGDLKQWVEYLESSFSYTIRFDVANIPNEKDIPPEMQNAVFVAYGLALKSLNASSPLGEIKLLPKEDRRSSLPQMLSFLGVECAVVLVFFLLVRFLAFQPYLMHLENQANQILEPVKQVSQELAAKSIPELEGQQSNLAAKVRQVKSFTSKTVFFSSLFSAVGEGLPASILLDYINFEDQDSGRKEKSSNVKTQKRMNLKGVCYLGSSEKESDVINTWVKALAAKKVMAEYFSEIKMEEIKREKLKGRDMTRFQILGD